MIEARDEMRQMRAGFTLVELIVASTLLTIVMAGVYTTFSTSVRVWRSAESNYQTYEDARRAFGFLVRELRSIPQDALHLVNGTEDMIEFVTLAQPMHVISGDSERLMRVRYRLVSERRGGTATLQREEALLEGPLPISGATDDLGEPLELALGRSYDFTLASGVEHFSFYYTWAIAKPHFPQEPPPWAEIIGDGVVEAGLPEGIEVTLVLHDPGSVSGGFESTFKDVVTFRSASSPVPSYLLRLTGN